MAKLIPGKVRIEGVALYETGKVDIIKEKNNRLYARVAEEELRYSLEDDLVFCACDFFQKRGYCVHLAALGAFSKKMMSVVRKSCRVWKKVMKKKRPLKPR